MIVLQLTPEGGRMAARCDGNLHAYIDDNRYLIVRCRSKRCRGRGTDHPVYHRFDLLPVLEQVHAKEETCRTERSDEGSTTSPATS